MRVLLYISLGIALFLTHTPLLFTISPGAIRPDFEFALIFNPEFSEMVIVSVLKSIAFSVGTISIIQLLKNSNRKQMFKTVSIWFFAVLDGGAWALYVNWMDIEAKNNVASIYYLITFSMLIGFIAFLSVEQKQNKPLTLEKQCKTLSKQGYSQRAIAGELNISLSKVNKLVNAK